MTKRKRLFILDDAIESCRLMPIWIQYVFFSIMLGVATLIVPIISYFFLFTIIILQLVFILLLVKKFSVYRKISKLEIAVKKMVIWISTKKDENQKFKKAIINFSLIVATSLLFYKLQNFKLLIINSLFCFIFFLKLLFYVPLISVRIVVDDDKNESKFLVIDKGVGENTDFFLNQIISLEVKSDQIAIETNDGIINIPIDFQTKKERENLKLFLQKLNRFEVK